jgi:hypothetical protein
VAGSVENKLLKYFLMFAQFFGADIHYHITCPNPPDPDAVTPIPKNKK